MCDPDLPEEKSHCPIPLQSFTWSSRPSLVLRDSTELLALAVDKKPYCAAAERTTEEKRPSRGRLPMLACISSDRLVAWRAWHMGEVRVAASAMDRETPAACTVRRARRALSSTEPEHIHTYMYVCKGEIFSHPDLFCPHRSPY